MQTWSWIALVMGFIVVVALILAIVTDSIVLWRSFSMIGEETVYVVLAIVLYNIEPSLGFLMITALMLSANINIFLKNTLAVPRPPKELWRAEAEGYAFPSGHTQTSSTFWYTLAFRYRSWQLLFFATCIVASVAISRIALRVHWISDVVGGYILGLAIAYTLSRCAMVNYVRTMLVAICTAIALGLVSTYIAHEAVVYPVLGTSVGLLLSLPIYIRSCTEIRKLDLARRCVSTVLTLILAMALTRIAKTLPALLCAALYIPIPVLVVSIPWIVCRTSRRLIEPSTGLSPRETRAGS